MSSNGVVLSVERVAVKAGPLSVKGLLYLSI
jgi:hypothetical protein